MKQKELLLWVVAIAALTLSLIAVIGPKGLKSDAAMRSGLQQVGSVENYTGNPIIAGDRVPLTPNTPAGTECYWVEGDRIYLGHSDSSGKCLGVWGNSGSLPAYIITDY